MAGEPAFLVEKHLGRLARWLRLLGYDAALQERPPALVPPGRVLLTRRRRLRGRRGVVWVAADRPEDQLRQVIGELGLHPSPARRFSRCLDCNRPVEPVSREDVSGLVPDYVLHTAARFTRCPGCGRVFWPGSHGRRAAERLARILGRRDGA